MKNRKMLLPSLLSIALVFSFILLASMLNTAPVMAQGQVTFMVAADTTVSARFYHPPECDVGNWTNIIQVAAGGSHTVGLRSNGTVVAAPDNEDFEWCDVGNWRDIIQVAGGSQHTVGLKSDGTVVAACGWLTDVAPTPTCSMAEEIQILREFRDKYLLTNSLGQALVGLYYRLSPPMAEFITEHPSLKPIVRAGLVPAVAMSAIAVNTTPAEKMAIIGLLALIAVALAVWAKRRLGRGPEYT
jgi:hypothetical protein